MVFLVVFCFSGFVFYCKKICFGVLNTAFLRDNHSIGCFVICLSLDMKSCY